MAPKNRKAGKAEAREADDIPLARPPKDAIDDIPEEEKIRILNESGLMGQMAKIVRPDDAPPVLAPVPEVEEQGLGDEIFFSLTMIIPLTFLYLCMDIVIHHQYAQQVTAWTEFKRVGSNFPFLAGFIFYTNRHRKHWLAQTLFFLVSTLCGTGIIYQVNRARWDVVMQQAAPLSTLWTYACIQSDLLPCGISLLLVAGFTKYFDLHLTLPY